MSIVTQPAFADTTQLLQPLQTLLDSVRQVSVHRSYGYYRHPAAWRRNQVSLAVPTRPSPTTAIKKTYSFFR